MMPSFGDMDEYTKYGEQGYDNYLPFSLDMDGDLRSCSCFAYLVPRS